MLLDFLNAYNIVDSGSVRFEETKITEPEPCGRPFFKVGRKESEP
jgi:hypothetical protein